MSEWLDAEAHADRALEMYERGRWAEAEAELRKALCLNPDQAEWHFNLGLTLEAAGRDAEALASYDSAVELSPEQTDPLLAAGVVANRLGHYEWAIDRFERALRLDSGIELAYANLIDSQIHLGRHDEAETTFYLAQQSLSEASAQCLAAMAESLIQRQAFQRAEWCLRQAIRLEPTLPRVRARLATVFAATGRPQRALQLFLRELRDDPGAIDTLLEYGELLFDLKRWPEAGEKFRRVLELEPANEDAHFALGRIALAEARYQQAQLEFELVIKLNSHFPLINLSIGEALLRQGFLAEARTHLISEYELMARAFDSNAETPQNPLDEESSDSSVTGLSPECTLWLADLLLEVNEHGRAACLYEQIVEKSESVDVLRQLARARFLSGDRHGGVEASRRVLELDPSCARSIHNLALAALEKEHTATALEWVKRGLRAAPHDQELRRLRVRVWLAQLRSIGRFIMDRL